ncbi:MAG TPA: MucR family transcriptional regulator [Alphaproteobacteria bacterium]|jgi:predicted transcriptional regulator|nr:MucR family transcriptional regulator [Alphaproteobacteria bacterium]
MTDSENRGGRPELAGLTSQIVAAYVSRNALPLGDLPALIHSVYQSLVGLGHSGGAVTGQEPAVPVKKSVTPDYIICLEDGKRLKMLKRYLRTRYDMTPEEYRRKWNLPADYPVVAPNYAAQRSAFAKKIGLGHIGTGRGRKRKR